MSPCNDFKIVTLTYEVLKFQQPTYLLDLFPQYNLERSLRSSNNSLLKVPDIRLKMDRRSFAFSVPTIWKSRLYNNQVHNSDSISSLRPSCTRNIFHHNTLSIACECLPRNCHALTMDIPLSCLPRLNNS